ncbi:MAG: PSD1 domain-containing protein [Planctomycetales bacterium]|nr:PSD1 domain-containing protein [Planctomycetales bacterium]
MDFNRDVRPILSDKCFYCHGPDPKHREADLRLDEEQAAKADLGGYHAVVAGDAEASEIYARIIAHDDDERMPPADSGKELMKTEIELLRQWINQGATWSKHWAYVPPQQHAAPSVVNESWPTNWIDNFVLSKIEDAQLAPAASADPVTLIRRLYFDLTGLPPTPDQVDRFVADPSDAAYEELVHRLLASEHFGERMAMYWLDLVRYADTVGYHGDQDHNISPYRDYVIDAFNRNLPFDQFTREQLAGDLLPNATIDQQIATGYNRLLQTSHEGGVQPKEYLAIYAADRVRNVSAVWMGATLGCCQCHNHKFDPLTMKDFYSLAAFFADVDEAQHFKVGSNSLPTKRPPEISVLSRAERATREELQEQRQSAPSEEARKAIDRDIAGLDKRARLTMVTVAIAPREMRILPRGNWLDDSGPIVEPAVPEYLGRVGVTDRRATRLDLANWLTDAQTGAGGLTARVQANRFWYLFFGAGLAPDLDDFGGQGEPPSHPELLDQLAIEFMASDWNVKHLVQLIVQSSAYRQASVATNTAMEQDPYNRLFARQARFRLPAEMVRDTALAISGLLVDERGGPSARPYQPAGYYRHLNFPQRTYHADTNERQWRRGVYVHWQRQFLHPMFKAFDAPSREECTAERPRSNTPLAALALLNDPTFVEAARSFAARILAQENASDAGRLQFAFRTAVSRVPAADEADILERLLARSRAFYAAEPKAAHELLSVGQTPAPSTMEAVELAAWTQVARAVLNLSETTTRQ